MYEYLRAVEANGLDSVNQSIGKALDQFDIEHDLFRRWSGDQANSRTGDQDPS